MKEKTKNFFKKLILILSVYFSWLIILYDPYSDSLPFQPIPFTILTIYIWNSLHKNK